MLEVGLNPGLRTSNEAYLKANFRDPMQLNRYRMIFLAVGARFILNQFKHCIVTRI